MRSRVFYYLRIAEQHEPQSSRFATRMPIEAARNIGKTQHLKSSTPILCTVGVCRVHRQQRCRGPETVAAAHSHGTTAQLFGILVEHLVGADKRLSSLFMDMHRMESREHRENKGCNETA